MNPNFPDDVPDNSVCTPGILMPRADTSVASIGYITATVEVER